MDGSKVFEAILNMAGIKITDENRDELKQAILGLPEIPATVNEINRKLDFLIKFIESEYAIKYNDGSNNSGNGITDNSGQTSVGTN